MQTQQTAFSPAYKSKGKTNTLYQDKQKATANGHIWKDNTSSSSPQGSVPSSSSSSSGTLHKKQVTKSANGSEKGKISTVTNSVWNAPSSSASPVNPSLNGIQFPALSQDVLGIDGKKPPAPLPSSEKMPQKQQDVPSSWSEVTQKTWPNSSSKSTSKEPSTSNFKLGSDTVGKSTPSSLKNMLGQSSSIDAYFSTSPSTSLPSSSPKKKLLIKYTASVAKSSNPSWPSRYLKKHQKYAGELKSSSGKVNDETWEDAMLHNPPIALLKKLDKLYCLISSYQSDKDKAPLNKYVFPCTLTFSSDNVYAFEKLILNKDVMCFEFSLEDDVTPIHGFFRPLNEKDANENKLIEEMKNKPKQFSLVEFNVSSSSSTNTPEEELSATNPFNETKTHMEFYSEYGVVFQMRKLGNL